MAYAFIALGVVLLLTTGFAGCEHKARIAAEQKYEMIRTTLAQMVAIADMQKKETDERLVKQEKSNKANIERGKRERAELTAELERMRNNPVRPDGSAVPTSTCPGSGTDGVPPKLVPLAEYESLQARAAADAQDWVRLQDYVTDVCLRR